MFLKTTQPYIVLENTLPVREMAQFQRLYNAIENQSRSEPSPQAEKQHLAALVASQCLHGSIIDNFDRMPEGLLKAESDPAAAQVMRFRDRVAVENWSRIPERDNIVAPIDCHFFDAGDHLFRCHLRAGRKLAMISLAGCEELDVCATHIDY